MTFKETINNALAEVKNPKALKAKDCIVESIKSDIYSDNEYHFALSLSVGGQLLFEYSGRSGIYRMFSTIKICAITAPEIFSVSICCEDFNAIDKKTKDYLRFSIENALRHLYFVKGKEIETRFKTIKNGK